MHVLLRAIVVVVLLLGGFAATDATAQAPGEAQYVASARGRVYYWIGCSAWKRLSPSNLRYYRSAAEAESAGYKPSQSRGCAPQYAREVMAERGGRAACVVERVIDADTFVCEGGSRVRLLLIDAPELGQEPFGPAARDSALQLLPTGAKVMLHFDVELRDRYERLLAYVYHDSILVNRELVRRGLALVSVYPPNVTYVELMRAAADSARMERRGLWSLNGFACLPADFRANRCR